jgi:hypothetical protein
MAALASASSPKVIWRMIEKGGAGGSKLYIAFLMYRLRIGYTNQNGTQVVTCIASQ